MPKTKFSQAEIAKAIGSKRHEPIKTPFYFAPPFLDRLMDFLKKNVKSTGGRPGLSKLAIVRKTRYSKATWKRLTRLSELYQRNSGVAISPAQIAASIVEETVGAHT